MEERKGYNSIEDLEAEGYLAKTVHNDIEFISTFPPTNLKLPAELQDQICALLSEMMVLFSKAVFVTKDSLRSEEVTRRKQYEKHIMTLHPNDRFDDEEFRIHPTTKIRYFKSKVSLSSNMSLARLYELAKSSCTSHTKNLRAVTLRAGWMICRAPMCWMGPGTIEAIMHRTSKYFPLSLCILSRS